jgi:3-deoxy-D-manno-octulosonic-acid transferase
VIAGSSYLQEEQMLKNFISQYHRPVKLLIVPHFVDENHISSIMQIFPGARRFSDPGSNQATQTDVVIVDRVGLLSAMYRYADIAFIGGGFKPGGLHNVLEPAVFGMPVLFGPELDKFPEAKEMKNAGVGFSIESQEHFNRLMMTLLADEGMRKQIAERSHAFVNKQLGATQKIMEVVKKEMQGKR